MKCTLSRTHLATFTVLLALLIFPAIGGSAEATEHYAGNSRNPAYGVKADISTPSYMPTVVSGAAYNWVSNFEENGLVLEWVQVGWAQGDGIVWAKDGTRWPTVPTSYQEIQVNGVYDLYLYSAQPLNFTRTYEVVHTGYGIWQGIIAGGRRYSAGPFATPVLVLAMTEIAGTTQPHTRASFYNVQYKGNYSYMPFDQYNRRMDLPPYARFDSNSQYHCWNPN